jgi:hypothetical protein
VAITKSFSINRLDRTHCQNFTWVHFQNNKHLKYRKYPEKRLSYSKRKGYHIIKLTTHVTILLRIIILYIIFFSFVWKIPYMLIWDATFK